LSDVFNLGYTVKILVAISRVAYLVHYNTVQLYKLKLPGKFKLVQNKACNKLYTKTK